MTEEAGDVGLGVGVLCVEGTCTRELVTVSRNSPREVGSQD